MLIPGQLMPHGGKVSYRVLLGDSAYGKQYGDPVTPERANIEDKTTLVRNSFGEQVVSSSKVWLDPEHVVPPESLVTVWIGTPRQRESTVIVSAYHEHPGLPEHTELALE